MSIYFSATVRYIEDVKLYLLPPTEIFGGTREDGYLLCWHIWPKMTPEQDHELSKLMPLPFSYGVSTDLLRGSLDLCYTPDDMLFAARMDAAVVDWIVDPPPYRNSIAGSEYLEGVMTAMDGLSDRTKRNLMQIVPAGGRIKAEEYPYSLLNVPLWRHFLSEITRAISEDNIPFPCREKEDGYWVALLEAWDWWRRKLQNYPVYRDIRNDLLENVDIPPPEQLFWGERRHQCYALRTEPLLESGVPTP